MPIAPECIIRVGSIPEFLVAVDVAAAVLCTPPQSQNCELWYRGQVQKGFTLIPNIARAKIDGLQLNALLESVFLGKFQSLAVPYVETLPAQPLPDGIQSYWSWLFEMQHYGVPTRLLDWSRDALVALFFATNPEDPSLKPGIDSVVWVLNPVTLNEAFDFNPNVKPGYIPNVQESGFNLQFGPNGVPTGPKPAAAIGPLNSTRIAAQRGVFTVFPLLKNLIPLEQFPDSSQYLFKICIASESVNNIQTELQRYGITKISLFPEIQSVAGEIIKQVTAESIQSTDP